jgi:hypothetical protein
MILLKDKVLIGKTTNSHSMILEQHNIKDEELKPNFVKVEIVPTNNNYMLPLEQWVYNIDQDYLPDWYVHEVDELRAREALKQWYREHIELQNTDTPNSKQTAGYYSTQTAGSCSTQIAGDQSTQTAGSCSTQIAGYGSIQTAGDRSTQKAGSGSTQTAGSESTQTAGYYSTQTAGYYSTQTAGDQSTQTAGSCSTQIAGDQSTQTAGSCSTQIAGYGSIQKAEEGSIQTAGVGTVQIIGYYNNAYNVKTRVITEKEANKPYKFYNGDWQLIQESEGK